MSTISTMNPNACRSLSHSIWAQTTDWRNGPTAPGSKLKAPKYAGLPWQTAAFRRVCAQPVFALTAVVGLVEWLAKGVLCALAWVLHACLPQGDFKSGFQERVVTPLEGGTVYSAGTCLYSISAFFCNPWASVV